MELEFKPDFDAARADWDRFWRGELDRPLVAAEVPKPDVEPAPKPPYIAGHDGNFTPVIDGLLRWAETHEFVGAAIPFWYLEFAAAHFALLLGADLRSEDIEGNGWIVPFVDDLADADLRFRPECFWWERTVAFAEELKRRCSGRLLICSPTLVANVDALSAVYSNQKLLYDLVDRPDVVHRALDQIDRAHAEIIDALTDLLDVPTWGSLNRHGMYGRGYTTIPQCDFSAMISADMFREFVQPALRREMARLDGVEYHLDGPGALQHLAALCEIDELDVVQWVPGSGSGEEQDWTDLYLRIDELGKGQILGGDAASLRRWRERLRTKKLYWRLSAKSREEAEVVIAGL
jgi:5-methyltetrahydrofolate--homocysteine methyltransferase